MPRLHLLNHADGLGLGLGHRVNLAFDILPRVQVPERLKQSKDRKRWFVTTNPIRDGARSNAAVVSQGPMRNTMPSHNGRQPRTEALIEFLHVAVIA